MNGRQKDLDGGWFHNVPYPLILNSFDEGLTRSLLNPIHFNKFRSCNHFSLDMYINEARHPLLWGWFRLLASVPDGCRLAGRQNPKKQTTKKIPEEKSHWQTLKISATQLILHPLTAGGGTFPCGSEKCWDGFKLQRGHVHFRWLCSHGFRSCCSYCSMDATLLTLHRRWDRSHWNDGMPCKVPFFKRQEQDLDHE